MYCTMTKGENEFVPDAVTVPDREPPELVTVILPVKVPDKL